MVRPVPPTARAFLSLMRERIGVVERGDIDEDGRGDWQYPDELAEALARFGLAPTGRTPPLMVRTALNGLYRYELRRLRDRLLARQIQKPDYLAQVVVLRKKYWPLSLLPAAWERICRGDL